MGAERTALSDPPIRQTGLPQPHGQCNALVVAWWLDMEAHTYKDKVLGKV